MSSPCRLYPLRRGKRLRYSSCAYIEEGIVGRRELLECCWKACGYRCHPKKKLCSDCAKIQEWAIRGLSRQMLRISHSHLQIKGMNALDIVRVNGKKLSIPEGNPHEWAGSVTLQTGMLLTLKRDDFPDAALEFDIELGDKEVQGMESKIAPSSPSVIRTSNEGAPKMVEAAQRGALLCPATPSQTSSSQSKGSAAATPVKDTPELLQRMKRRIELEAPHWQRSLDFSQSSITSSQMEGGMEIQAKPQHEELEDHVPLNQTTSDCEAPAARPPESPPKKRSDRKTTLFFVQLGRSLPLKRIQILSDVARRKGALVVDNLDGLPKPTHMVVDPNVRAAAVAKRLKIKGPPQLAAELQEVRRSSHVFMVVSRI